MQETHHLIYKTHEFAKQKSEYALVIPVINEGERLASLLDRMGYLDIFQKFDVIVTDGGSTDGSVAETRLRARGVNTLLVKQSEGSLGTQLQCAYNFALNRGYRGVVTIDGNNKDNPAGVFRMKRVLDEGIDFAQGSRFISGSIHTNTPWMRLAAVRLVHAPLLSLFSGHKWTDTTQGFRGYSRKLLKDTGLCLFREELSDYNLLFYISKRAPQLGFRCVEVPTERNYPLGTETPTKIVGVVALARILTSLLIVCFGWYDVKGKSKSRTWFKGKSM